MSHAIGDEKGSRAGWLQQVEAICQQRGVQLTPLRRQVLGLVASNAGPVTAYTLIDELARIQSRTVAPPTIYRTLDFLVENGFVIKVESRNAFAVCDTPGHHHHGILLICTQCGGIDEIDDHAVDATLLRTAAAVCFRLEKQMVELEGVCGRCANA